MPLGWAKKPIRNVLLDINGVLFDSGEDHPIAGSVEAMKKLVENGFNFCLVTNECTTAKRLLAKKLNSFGYDCVNPDKIVSPAPVACRYLLENQLRPRLHVWDGVLEDFEPILAKIRQEDQTNAKLANCLVVGDVMNKLGRDYMDESLEIMLNSQSEQRQPVRIVSLGAGRYYKDSGRLRMDTGAYVAAFEYCLGVRAVNLGKPTGEFFKLALDVVGGTTDDTIMIGDDIRSDVGGAQELGMRGFLGRAGAGSGNPLILQRTGKYKRTDETESGVKADGVFDNLKEAIEVITAEAQRE